MKVRFNLKDKGGLVLLKFRYKKGGLPLVFSTRQHIQAKNWDKSTMRAMVRNMMQQPHLADLNSLLNRMENEVLSVYRKNVGEVPLTHDLFRSRLNKIFFKQHVQIPTLIEFIRKDMSAMNRAGETLANYRHVANVLSEYTAHRGIKTGLDDVGFEWLAGFQQWCFERNYATSTVGKFVAVIKTAINLARKRGITENRDVLERGFSVKKSHGNRKKLALYPHEVNKIAAIDWPTVKHKNMSRRRLERTAAIILAGCFTGLRHSDFDKITRRNIRKFRSIDVIEVWTQKTDKPVAIPLDARLKEILERYDYQLPALSRGEILTVGREVLRLASIEREVAVRETNGGKTRIVHYHLCDKFSAHVTRRTFARNAYLEDPSLLPAIQAILGHATEAQTLEYIDVEDMLTAEHFAARMELKKVNLKII